MSSKYSAAGFLIKSGGGNGNNVCGAKIAMVSEAVVRQYGRPGSMLAASKVNST